MNDLCNAMATLKSDADADGAVRDVLSINPGIPDDAHLFSYIGYKGGSEPGVLSASWLLQRASDRTWRYCGVAWNDPQHAVDQDRFEYLAGAGRALLAR
jgi:hypothetical protein